MLLDLRHAFRQLAKAPGFAAVVVLTLAFGIAVNTTIFGIVGVIFFQRMQVPEADRLVLLLQRNQAWNAPHAISFPDFKDYRERIKGLESLVAYSPMPAHLAAGTDAPQRAWLEVMTPNAFAALGVQPLHGRLLVPADGEAAGAAPVAVLSYGCWKQRFGADPSVVGHTIRLNNHPFTIVGVAPESFTGLSPFLAVHAFVPTGALDSLKSDGAGMLEWRNAPLWRTLGKLRHGVAIDSVRAEAEIATAQLNREHPDSHRDVASVVMPEYRGRPDPSIAELLPVFAALFLGQVVLVLGIACANVANLMLARAASRQKEFTVRAALGASRAQIIRQMLVESVLLAAMAGIVGWLLSDWTAPLLGRIAMQGDLPVVQAVPSLWPQRLFTVAISVLAGLGSGLLPALRASRFDLGTQLREGTGATKRRHRLRDHFVVAQVVFSLVVLVFAVLFARSLHSARSLDVGFRYERTLTASFDLSLQGYTPDQRRQFCRQALERIRALPGVEDATVAGCVPFDYSIGLLDILPENSARPDTTVGTGYSVVAPGYERALGLRRVSGRFLEESDTEATRPVAVVNSTFAERCWPGRDPLGRRFQPWRDGPFVEVVGVVATAKYMMLSEAPRPFYYTPIGQRLEEHPFTLLVRAKDDPSSLSLPVRNVLAGLDPHLPVYDVRTMDELMASSIFALMPLRLGVTLASVQGGIGLCLAVMGLYAVVAFGVNQRTREIGLRIALGASPADVVREVLRDGLRLALLGTAIGLLLSVGLGFVLSQVLFGMRPFDPLALLGGAVVLLGVAAFACWFPARRAASVDPMIALRAE
jgi:predicted permease